MEIRTKKYRGNALRAYKVLMRKLSTDGFYHELRKKEYFKSKSQIKRDAEFRGKIRTKKKLAKIKERIEAETYYRRRPRRKRK